MAYLAQPTTVIDYGVVKIGDYINVADGVISIPQSVDPNADIVFSTITDSSLTDGRIVFAGLNGLLSDDDDLTYDITSNTLDSLSLDGESVITSVTPTAGVGISITNLIETGPSAGFKVNNTGVLSLIAGGGISISSATGNITISSTGADLISVYGTTTNYTATATDEYIGVFSDKSITITLPTGITGRVYTIKDEYGQGSGKITIQPQSGEKVDNRNNYVISVPNQCISLVFRAGSWRII
jgi:hypothetical protein